MRETKEIVKNESEVKRESNYSLPLVNIYETENEYVLTAEMPGVSKENLNVSLDNRVLTIEGRVNEDFRTREAVFSEFRPADYFREFKVGTEIDVDNITANIKSGVLTLTLTKSPQAKPRKIQITTE